MEKQQRAVTPRALKAAATGVAVAGGLVAMAPQAGAVQAPDYGSTTHSFSSCNNPSASDLKIFKLATGWANPTKIVGTVPKNTPLTVSAANGYSFQISEGTTTSGSVSVTAGGSLGPFAKVEGEVKAGIERSSNRTIGQTYTLTTSATFTNTQFDSGRLVAGVDFAIIETVRTTYKPNAPGQPAQVLNKTYHYTIDSAGPCFKWEKAA